MLQKMRECAFFILLFPTCLFANNVDPKEIHPLYSNAHWGFLLVDDKNNILYSKNEDQLFIPASVTKIFTTTSILEQIDAQQTIDTCVHTNGPIDSNGTLHGDLILTGSWDPTLKTQDLKELANKVSILGIKTILGKIITDSTLTVNTLPIHCEIEDIPTDYAQEQAALSINNNMIQIKVSANHLGYGLAETIIDQEVPYCDLINGIMTTNEKTSLNITRGLTDNVIRLSGNIQAGAEPKINQIAVHNPQEYGRLIFEKALREFNIEVKNFDYKQKLHNNTLVKHTSGPICNIVETINKLSDNFCADMLLRYAICQTTNNLMADLANRIGIEKNSYKVFDGSGLSRHNLLSPGQVVKLLQHAKTASYNKYFLASLPINGEYGSLKTRFQKLPKGVCVRAKTGGMSGIANLAGYIETKKQIYTFCFFINNSLWSESDTKKALDTFLLRIIAEKNL